LSESEAAERESSVSFLFLGFGNLGEKGMNIHRMGKKMIKKKEKKVSLVVIILLIQSIIFLFIPEVYPGEIYRVGGLPYTRKNQITFNAS